MPRQAAQIGNDLGAMFRNGYIGIYPGNATIGVNNVRITARKSGDTQIHPGTILAGKRPTRVREQWKWQNQTNFTEVIVNEPATGASLNRPISSSFSLGFFAIYNWLNQLFQY
mgnify:CR=1 FL=1